jgi:hypothetical protein
MVLKIFKRKAETLGQVEKDIEKLQKQITKEKKFERKMKQKSDLLQRQKRLKKSLFAERKQLRQDLKSMKKHHTRLGRTEEKIAGGIKSAKKWTTSKDGRKTLKALDKFFGG